MLWGFIWNFIQQNLVLTAVGAITLVQIAPIKINPWTHIGKCIRGFFCGDIEAKLDKIARKVDQLEKQVEDDKARNPRTHINRFADELYEKKQHTQEYFLQILDDAKFYEEYVASHKNFANGRTENACKIIRETYKKCWEEHKF